MSFDFSTLITDRTYADVSRVKELTSKIRSGTASESELAEFNSAAMKGAYNHTDLNRVTAAMEALKAKLEGYGYNVPGYQRIKVPHVLPEPEPTSRLPEGYIELAWIESTGTQYVDTSVFLNNNSKVVADCEITYGTGWTMILGSYGSSDRFSWWTNGAKISPYYGATGKNADGVTGRTTLIADKNKWSDGASEFSFTETSFVAAHSMYLFSVNNGGNYANATMKLYSCQIYDNGTLVRDYIPCINPDGSVGLYDLVTAAFFGNSGTGSFVAGAIPRKLPDGYTQVEYIQSSGTQYIDTGFKHNQDTRVVMDVFPEEHTANAWLFEGRNSSSDACKCLVWVNGYSNWIGYYNDSDTRYKFTDLASSERLRIDHNKNICTVNGYSYTWDAVNFQSTCNLVLLACNTAGAISGYAKAKLYSCRIYDNGTLIRDFVPCENSSGVIGMYDLANDVFYQNAGSGTFAAGEEVTALAVSSVSTVSAMVVSGDAAEYDLYTWYEFDAPSAQQMKVYLLNVSLLRAVFAVMASTPQTPVDMAKLMLQEANNIETILLDVYRQLTIMPTTFIPCGEALCGGDNL